MGTFKEFLKRSGQTKKKEPVLKKVLKKKGPVVKKKGPALIREGLATPPGLGEYQVVIEGFTVHFVFDAGSSEAALFEARHRGTPLGGQYSALLHKPHIPGGKTHLHVYAKQNQLFAINQDGTAHDRSHGARIPNRVADAIRKQYPQFALPVSTIIEAAPEPIEGAYQLLLG
jgi:hypothetical protein